MSVEIEAAIIGGAMGAVVAVVGSYLLSWRQARQELKALRLALAIEVANMRELLNEPVRVRFEGATDRGVLRAAEEENIPQALSRRFPNGLRHHVFLANLDKIGSLGPDLARRTARFYQAMMDYEADIERAIAGEIRHQYMEPNLRSVFHKQLRLAVRADIMERRLRGQRGVWKFRRRSLTF